MSSVTHVRVRYKDTDTMSVVYYGNYLTYFEVARVEYMRERGLPISSVNTRIHMPVVEAYVKYLKPARLDDLLELTCRVSERKRASFTFSYVIRSEAKELLATGFTRHACVDAATSRMIALPGWLKEIMPDADLDSPAQR